MTNNFAPVFNEHTAIDEPGFLYSEHINDMMIGPHGQFHFVNQSGADLTLDGYGLIWSATIVQTMNHTVDKESYLILNGDTSSEVVTAIQSGSHSYNEIQRVYENGVLTDTIHTHF